MPVYRFRSAEEMNQPRWREPGDPELYRAIASVTSDAAASAPSPEQRPADTDQRRPLLHRHLEVVAHPHGQLGEAPAEADLGAVS